MKTINSTTQTTDILSLKDFCDLTRKAYQLKYFPTDTIVHNTNGWTKLADMWVALIDEEDIDLFSDVAYFIKWRHPASGPTPEYQTLVTAVSNALTQDGPAYDAWINHSHCYCTVYETAREFNPWTADGTTYSYSELHHRYTAFKMLLSILRYRKGYITDCKKYASFVRYYEKRIVKLLPHASTWSLEDWANENYIFAELEQVCHFNYCNDLSSYSALLQLATSPKRMPTDRDSSTIHSIGNVKAFSDQLLSRIWPHNTQNIAIQLFFLAEKRAEEVFYTPECSYTIGLYDPLPDVDYSTLRHSWIYSYIYDLYIKQALPTETKDLVKRVLFNINTRC